MREIDLNITRISEPGEAHRYLSEVFKFPDYYGNNLDALYDCLTDISELTYVTFFYDGIAKDSLGWYEKKVIQVFEDAARRNRHLVLQ